MYVSTPASRADETAFIVSRCDKRALQPLSLFVACVLSSSTTVAHPGSGIVVDSQGIVYVADIGRGLLKFTPDGRVTVVLSEAGALVSLGL